MNFSWQKILSFALAFIMVVGIFPGNVFAADNENGGITIINTDSVAEVNGVQYESLSAAIVAATAGQTITLLADITEDVTVKKNLTIDGAGFKYTGNIAVTGSTVAVNVKNVNFVDGTGYAITTNTIKSITVENCTVTGYGYGFLYANKSTTTVVVKNVEVSDCNYGFHWVYGTSATLENVKMTNVTNGLYIQNYASKTITLKNCDISSISIWERDGYSGVQTFKFVGANTVGTLSNSQYAKYVLVAADATLTASAGANVTTTVEGMVVIYKNGVYQLAKAVAMIGNVLYASIQDAVNAAQDGDTIVVTADHEMIWDGVTKIDGRYAAMVCVAGKAVTIDLNGKEITGTTFSDMFAAFAVDEGGSLTLTDSVGTGSVTFTGETTSYCLLMGYEAGAKLIVDGGIYYLENASDSLIYSGGASDIVTINGGNFTLGNVGDGSNGKPWIFNVLGAGENHVIVNGGTFNADVNHQFWAHEVEILKELALKDNGDGTWTVVNAVAYVLETNHGYTRNVGYATLEEAVASEYGNVITLLADNAEDVTVDKAVTLNLNGFEYTGTITLGDAEASVTTVAGLNVVTTVNGYQVTYANGMYKLALIVAVRIDENGNEVGSYISVADALNAAQSGDTVKLLQNVTESMVMITKGVTLDLNGKTLTASYLVAFKGNHVVDNSTAKTGILEISKDNISLDKTNAQMPVYIAEKGGYAFAAVKLQTQVKSQTDNRFELLFRPSFGAALNSYFADGALDNDIEIIIRVTWTDAEGKVNTRDFRFTEELIKVAYGNGKSLKFVLTGIADFENVEVSMVVSSAMGVEVSTGNLYTYTAPEEDSTPESE